MAKRATEYQTESRNALRAKLGHESFSEFSKDGWLRIKWIQDQEEVEEALILVFGTDHKIKTRVVGAKFDTAGSTNVYLPPQKGQTKPNKVKTPTVKFRPSSFQKDTMDQIRELFQKYGYDPYQGLSFATERLSKNNGCVDGAVFAPDNTNDSAWGLTVRPYASEYLLQAADNDAELWFRIVKITYALLKELGIEYGIAAWGVDLNTDDGLRNFCSQSTNLNFSIPEFPYQTILPEWKSSSAIGLADAMSQEVAFDRMPVLADALEECGAVGEFLDRMRDATLCQTNWALRAILHDPWYYQDKRESWRIAPRPYKITLTEDERDAITDQADRTADRYLHEEDVPEPEDDDIEDGSVQVDAWLGRIDRLESADGMLVDKYEAEMTFSGDITYHMQEHEAWYVRDVMDHAGPTEFLKTLPETLRQKFFDLYNTIV